MQNEADEQARIAKEAEERKSYWQKMSKFEQIFWGTIVVFFVLYLGVSLLSIKNIPDKESAQSKKEPIVYEFFSTDRTKDNLTKHEQKIHESLNGEIEKIYVEIDTGIDGLFEKVEKNVDSFLDFHYSVKGEYTELGTMAFGDIEKLIEEKLFGANFHKKVESLGDGFDEKYKKGIEQHFKRMKELALEGIDTTIPENSEAITRLNEDIKRNFLIQGTKTSTLIGAGLALKIGAVISAKIAAKAVTKGTTKAGAKMTAKMTAAGTGATAGLACGPFAWVCAPVAATALWFATDAVVVTVDESFTRDKFKLEILSLLQESKQTLKESFKASYYEEFAQFSSATKEKMKNTTLKEKRKVKELVGE